MSRCQVDLCEKPPRSKITLLCEMHYYRLRRTGTTDQRKPWHRQDGICAVDGCDIPERENYMCGKHARRVRRHGSPHIFISPADRAFPRGADHHAWSGAAASYSAAHNRVTTLFGPASGYACISCGVTAQHWSYTHDDPDELAYDGMRYSAWPEFYAPRCVRCHKLADLALIRARVTFRHHEIPDADQWIKGGAA